MNHVFMTGVAERLAEQVVTVVRFEFPYRCVNAVSAAPQPPVVAQ
ncbi:hypothetical protein [Sansalvadorimonas verongulae]|nr:hypothetical protein [Sansalvadorimonas verongulae]